MFKRLLFAGLIFTTINSRADDGQKVPSKVQKVIVFLSGAQVTRTARVNVTPGTSTLVFSNIAQSIDAQSIQVHASGDFTILSVKTELNYFNDQSRSKNVEDLQAQQNTIRAKIALDNGLLTVNQQEQNMLLKNQLITGQNSNLDVLKLKQALDFQTERLTADTKKQLSINSEIAALNVELQKYDNQIADINKDNTVSSNILVTVSAKAATESEFSLNYVVNDASWFPTYDIRAKNVNSPISISYKANVTQQSGEDWKNIRLTLSTGNPTVSGSKPQLRPYYLNLNGYYTQADKSNEVVIRGYGTQYKAKANSGYLDEVVVARAPEVNQVENQTNVDFNIADPYTIPSDGKQYSVQINDIDLKASYQYAVAPKLSTNVFLTAKVTDWNKYNLLPGEANLFFEGTYIGKSSLNANSTADTLAISLGTDKNIVVTRTLQKQLTARQVIGSDKKDTRDWMIEIKNRKNQPINLLVEDQVPVSQNAAIDVESQQVSSGALDPSTGKISWVFAMKPLDDKKLELKYQVKYPKTQPIIIE
ncbi:DUF4139 domain-containing protein [Mucilaginibacter sp. X5P1]|uniref:DUF4139 domain-containing protein n=1 Tax=Mucilaginibacter sp. X5P1 TaxID=2723088 RepID=UPI00162256D1|nr:DUF4139 domain-containing protein [Mucilaginibacter sp. X5P1]MBB6141593.1 uncharacterized protein (TIGR02231 family) [Mucilaginibacter sp. X5P1]